MNYVEEHKKVGYKSYNLWILFVVYLLGLAYSISKHELWGDEIHSWNIAKSSPNVLNLIHNIRYEGHPPVWYILLFSLSKFTHNVWSIQLLQYFICIAIAFILIFRMNLPLIYKVLILFGYYFFYEYTVFSRNYAIGILFSFLICSRLKPGPKFNFIYYYCLLFLLSNCHFLGFILAVSFHLYVLQTFLKNNNALRHGVFGAILLLPALYFIFPPSNSGLGLDFWFSLLTKDQVFIMLQAPLKALCPIPAWWEYHSWNTQAVIQAQKSIPFLKYIIPLLSIVLTGALIYILSKDKKALLFFLVNLFLTLAFALVFPLITARYVGFIFFGFVVSLCLLKETDSLSKTRRLLLYTVLIFQLAGTVISLKKDWQLPFSHAKEITSLMSVVPENAHVVVDYNSLNYFSAFMDRPAYCVEFNRERSFLLWDDEMEEMQKTENIYTKCFRNYFSKTPETEVYFVTNLSKESITKKDSLFFQAMNPVYITGMDDAIEKYSNIYLYKVTSSGN